MLLLGAGRALDRLGEIQHSLAIRYILTAAYEAHSGHLARAQAAWQQALTIQPTLKSLPGIVFARLSIAPEVRKRLLDWLAPVHPLIS